MPLGRISAFSTGTGELLVVNQIMHNGCMRQLSNGEHVCLVLASVGRSRVQIAKALGVEPGTVATHLNRVNLKFGTMTIADAVQKARLLGIIENENQSIVSRAVRRSLGLPENKLPKTRFATIREAIEIERRKRKV